MRLIQITNQQGERRICLVEDDRLRLVDRYSSVYALAQAALASASALSSTVTNHLSSSSLDYDELYGGRSQWRIMPAIDHPDEPARCLVSGTGLTHKRSADTRQAMHAAGEAPSDSMRMYQWGLEGGKPTPGTVGVAPEWFYKGCGTILRGHGEPLIVPPYAEDGGEEPEIACLYLVDASGAARRLGMTVGNEFSDHICERKNYLYLAASKLRTCAIGPELVIDPEFNSVPGEVAIERQGERVWSKPILSGEAAMSHSLANIEHHHFKYDTHRRPGDVHVHFLGAGAFSFGEGIELRDGDVMQISFSGFGRPLRNPVRIDRSPEVPVRAHPL